MYFDTKGLILSSRPVGEHDMLVRVLSGEHGLLQARLRGVRRPASRLKPLKEPGIFADLHLWGDPSAETSQLLTGIVLDSFAAARSRWETLSSVMKILHLTQTLTTAFDSKAQEKLDLTLETISQLAGKNVTTGLRHSRAGGNPVHEIGMFWIPACAGMTKKRYELLLLAFKLRLLDLSGWKFSSSETATLSLDAKIKMLCELLESGSGIGPDQEELATAAGRVVDLYIQKLT